MNIFNGTYSRYLYYLLVAVVVGSFSCQPKTQIIEQLVEKEVEVPVEQEREEQETRVILPEIPEPGQETEEIASEVSLQEQSDLEDIFFDYDKHNLSQQARNILDKNAKFLSDNPNVSIKIEGHCDDRGSNEYNLSLGEKRATSAKAYLEALGVPSEKIDWVSLGEEKPFDTGQNEEAWAKNRRAHFIVVSK